MVCVASTPGYQHFTQVSITTAETQAELQSLVIVLQSSIIDLLSHALASQPVNLSSRALITTSNTVRSGVVDALTQQYQRMLVAVPIQVFRVPPLGRSSLQARGSSQNGSNFLPNPSIQRSDAFRIQVSGLPSLTTYEIMCRTSSNLSYESLPSLFRVHQDDLAIETLDYFGLPWEYESVSDNDNTNRLERSAN
jgi:hypothetical protein